MNLFVDKSVRAETAGPSSLGTQTGHVSNSAFSGTITSGLPAIQQESAKLGDYLRAVPNGPAGRRPPNGPIVLDGNCFLYMLIFLLMFPGPIRSFSAARTGMENP